MESRVASIDPKRLRSFTPSWRLVGPFLRLMDRMTLRLVAAKFCRSTPVAVSTRT